MGRKSLHSVAREKPHKSRVPRPLKDTQAISLGSASKPLRVLEAVLDGDRPIRVAEIAARLGMSKPTTHRIVSMLANMGFLARELGSHRMIEGDHLVNLAVKILQQAAKRPERHHILQALADETGETSNLGIRKGSQVLYIDRVESRWPLGLRFSPGSSVPLHCTAIGKLLLSESSKKNCQAFLNSGRLVKYTENTITKIPKLLEELERIRTVGISEDNQEFMSGVVCLAAPLRATDGRAVAAVAISAPMARLTLEDIRQYAPKLRAAARKLSLTLAGGSRSNPS